MMKKCGTPMEHKDGTVFPCTLPKGHQVLVEDSDHVDAHGCIAPVLVHQSTLREVRRWQGIPFPPETKQASRLIKDEIHPPNHVDKSQPTALSCTCNQIADGRRINTMSSTNTEVIELAGPDRMYHPCTEGHHRHWGPDGAAGALCWAVSPDGTPFVLLARRSRHVQEGGTWAFPGGAVDQGESPIEAAVRELTEEVEGVSPDSLTAVIEAPCQHGCGWGYTSFLVRVTGTGPSRHRLPSVRVARGASAWETDCVAWIPVRNVCELRLHPGLSRTWPALRELIASELVEGALASGS